MRMQKKCTGPVSEGPKWRVLLTQQVVATHSAVALSQAGIRPEISWQQHSGVAYRPASVSSICSWRILFMLLYCTSLGLCHPGLLPPVHMIWCPRPSLHYLLNVLPLTVKMFWSFGIVTTSMSTCLHCAKAIPAPSTRHAIVNNCSIWTFGAMTLSMAMHPCRSRLYSRLCQSILLLPEQHDGTRGANFPLSICYAPCFNFMHMVEPLQWSITERNDFVVATGINYGFSSSSG